MKERLRDSFLLLKKYCEQEEFKGWDPYDGLNSTVFQALPFRKNNLARWIWIQLFKRSPLNLREIFLVKKDFNPKGLALFIIGYSNLYKLYNREEYFDIIIKLSDKLVELNSIGFSGSCWGYNFDWQLRNKYLLPKYTPTIVVTSFAVDALANAYEITQNEDYKNHIISVGNFITNDLKRSKREKGFLFSYSPFDGNELVYNASLLGSKALARIYQHTNDDSYLALAKESILACTTDQNDDGSWYYGGTKYQKWIDSFHTGYNLESIQVYQKISGDTSFRDNLEKGFAFYINNFFLDDGTAKYYHDKTFPIDIHSSAQLFLTLYHLDQLMKYQELAENVLNWTIKNMQTKLGYFIYQKKRIISSKIPYMRWSQAFMFYAMSHYLRVLGNK